MHKDIFEKNKENEKKDIIINICQHHMKPHDLFAYANTRKRPYVQMRQLAMYILREQTKLTLEQIGAIFNKDHATVLHACRQMEIFAIDESFYDYEMKSLYTKIRENIESSFKEMHLDLKINEENFNSEMEYLRAVKKLNITLINREIHRRERLSSFKGKLKYVPNYWARIVIKFIDECIAPL